MHKVKQFIHNETGVKGSGTKRESSSPAQRGQQCLDCGGAATSVMLNLPFFKTNRKLKVFVLRFLVPGLNVRSKIKHFKHASCRPYLASRWSLAISPLAHYFFSLAFPVRLLTQKLPAF